MGKMRIEWVVRGQKRGVIDRVQKDQKFAILRKSAELASYGREPEPSRPGANIAIRLG